MNLDLVYLLAAGACPAAALILWLSPPKWLEIAAWGAAFTSLSMLLLSLGRASGHLPIFGERLEAQLSVAWILCFLGILVRFLWHRNAEARFSLMGVVMCVAATLHVDLQAHPDAFWYSHWTAFGFFFFRVLAVAGVLLSGAFYAAALFDSEGSPDRRSRVWMGRNILLCATVLFGVSELSGCVWAQRGWGEFWLFNPGFMSSAGSFLILLIPFHLSGRWTRNPKVLPTVGALCSVVFLHYVMLRMH